MRVVKVTADNRSEHEAYVGARTDTTFVDMWPWHEVIDRAYSLPQFWYVAIDDVGVRGCLGLTLSTNRLFGRYLTTAPFGNQGGFYADSDAATDALFQKAADVQEEVGARYALIRRLSDGRGPPRDWVGDPVYATYHLLLDPDPERFFAERLRSIVRNRIKKARTHDLSVRFGHTELIEDFWQVINRAVRDLGSPYHSRTYLNVLMERHGQDAELVVLYSREGHPIGGSLLMHHPNVVSQLHVVCLRDYWAMYANDFLYWSVIAECCRRGLPRLDLGRSLVATGNERFKMKWRPERRPIDNWYRLSAGESVPHLNQANPRFDHARALWKRLPLPFAKLIGPRVMSGIL